MKGKISKKAELKLKPKYIIGVDEVGRGPIAGPVTVGAFVVSAPDYASVRKLFRGVKESKQLSEKKRQEWFAKIESVRKSGLIDFAVVSIGEKIIDGRGLSHCLKIALRKTLNSLNMLKGTPRDRCRVLLDGGLKAPAEFIDQQTIIKGDEKEILIALASICAKVTRDRRMCQYSLKYPQYGFHIHKGYGTRAHYDAVKAFGMCRLHRKSFLRNIGQSTGTPGRN